MTYVYFIQCGFGSVKIGVSDDPDERCATLQTGSQKPLRVIARFPMQNKAEAYAMERALHERLAPWRMKGEWFRKAILRELRGPGRKRLIGGTARNPVQYQPAGS